MFLKQKHKTVHVQIDMTKSWLNQKAKKHHGPTRRLQATPYDPKSVIDLTNASVSE